MMSETPDREDGFSITYAPQIGPRRRMRYETLSDGDWWRYVERLEGGKWYTEGRERVSSVSVDRQPVRSDEVFAGP
jgi:hypothetical protein